MRLRKRIFRLTVGGFILLWSLGPIYWALNVSLTNAVGLESTKVQFIPHPITLANYKQLLIPTSGLSSGIYFALRNSLIEAAGATIVTVAIALLGGYAFARWDFRGARLMFAIMIGTLCVPLLVVLLPLFQWTGRLGLLDTFPPIILVMLTASLPLALWIMRSFVASLPRDLESAARLDGASEVRILMQIILPLLRPAVAAVAIVVFLTTWAAFLVPLFFSQSSATEPLTVLIPNFVTRYSTNYGLQAAAGFVALLPPAVLVLGLRRFLVSGLLRGAFK